MQYPAPHKDVPVRTTLEPPLLWYLMLCDICNVITVFFVLRAQVMGIGPSGRIVIEVEPELKRELRSALLKDGQTLKDWFINQAEHYLRESQQLSFFDALPTGKQIQR